MFFCWLRNQSSEVFVVDIMIYVCIQWQQERSTASTSSCFPGTFQRVKKMQEKSREEELCFALSMVCEVQEPYFSSFFHIYSTLPTVYLLWDWRNVGTHHSVHGFWGFSSRNLSRAVLLTFEIFSATSLKLKALRLLSHHQPCRRSLPHVYSGLKPIIDSAGKTGIYQRACSL